MKELGQLYLVGFSGREFNEELALLLEKYHIGGLVLFGRNMPGTRAGLKKLISDIYEKAASLGMPPPFVAIDHEGGRVHRPGGLATHFPPPGRMGLLTDRELMEVYAKQSEELAFYGFNMVLGPVLDLCPGDMGHIGDRSFGLDPLFAIPRILIASDGLEKAGLITVPKHFPGHGDVDVDPHLKLPVIGKSLKDFEDIDLLPFRAIFERGAEIIMGAHVLAPLIDPEIPASLSAKWLDFLRSKLGFGGIFVSDDLCMKAVWDRYSIEDITEKGLRAGVDVFCICFGDGEFDGAVGRSFEHLSHLVSRDPSLLTQAKRSIEKIKALKKNFSRRRVFDNEAIFVKGHDLVKEIEKKCIS